MKADHIARERRLDAALSEVCGHGVPEGLAARVRLRVQASSRRPRSVHTWAAAGALLLGLSAVVVTAVDWSGGDPGAPGLDGQDKQVRVARIATSEVLASCPLRDGPAAGKGAERLTSLARMHRRALVVGPGLGGHSEVPLQALTFREAVACIAGELGGSVEEFEGTLVVTSARDRARAKPERLSLEVSKLPIEGLLQQLQLRVGVDFVIGPGVSGKLDLDVEGVPWRALLDHAARRLGLEVVCHGKVLAVRRAGGPVRGERVYLGMQDRKLSEVLSTYAKMSGANIVIDPEVRGTISVAAIGFVREGLFAALGRAVGAEVESDGQLLHVLPELPGARRALLSASQVGLGQLVEKYARRIGIEVGKGAREAGVLSVSCRASRVRDVLAAAACAAGHRLRRRGEGFVVD